MKTSNSNKTKTKKNQCYKFRYFSSFEQHMYVLIKINITLNLGNQTNFFKLVLKIKRNISVNIITLSHDFFNYTVS